MSSINLKPDLTVPDQKIASLSFCDATPKAFRDWLGSLPMANVGEVSRQLYHAIIELNQLFIAPSQRLQLLELIRPRIRFVCNELARHYLGLAVALPEKQRKIANLSQALQLHVASGYKTCLVELMDNGGLDKHRKALAIVCHRAISELGATIVRAHQLYCPSPARSWLECHRIFRFAHRNKLLEQTVEDETLTHRNSSSVGDAYKRILLLGCSRPNQLRQNELMQVYELFENWTDLVSCGPDLTSSLFVVDLERDASPVYRSLMQSAPGNDCFGFDTTVLAERITQHLQARLERTETEDKHRIPLPSAVTDTLLTHLSQALGILTKRNFNRIVSQGSLHVCVGLTAAHYFIAGEKNFNQFVVGNEQSSVIEGEDDNLFLSAARRRDDAWSGAHDAAPSDERLRSADSPITFRGSGGSADGGQPNRNQPRSYRTFLLNTSPGGYCVSWESEVPPALQAGEILGVREQLNHPWSVAVVRWIRQVRNQGTQVGIELLAPSASPCGVRLIQKVGNSSEYLRGLLLPEISAVDQAATLITPRLPFQSGSRISLLHDGREDPGQLSRRVSATGSVSQFELKLQNRQLSENEASFTASSSASEDEFDSLWPSL